jgi:flagellar motor switch protein FliN/FliY
VGIEEHGPEAEAVARPVKFESLEEDAGSGKPLVTANVELIQGVKVSLIASLGRAQLTVGELFALKEGAVVKLDRTAEEPVELYLDSRLVGRGELVVVGDHFAVRVTEFGKLSG